MKTKFILPIIALGLFAACSDDSSSPAAAENEVPTSSNSTEAVDPASSQSTDSTTILSSESADVLSSESSALPDSTNPAEDPLPNPDDPNNNPAGDSTVTPPTPKTYKYYGAELSGVDQFKYGRFEARMKMVSIPGSVSSMFLYYDDSWKKGVEPWNEIDIEVLGKGGTKWQSNIITREGDETIKANTSSESKPLHEFGFDATEDFHLFSMIWTPEYVAWEIDSVEVRRDTLGMTHGTHADADQVAFLTKTETLRFNLWAANSATWVGLFTGDELADGPQIQWIDYVRVYSYDEATKGFTVLWQDDFEGSSLSEHWTAGDWEMEKVMLSRDNVVVEDGYCKLMMTREEVAAP